MLRFDQLLEVEHDAGAALRVGRGPGGLRGIGGVDRLLQVGGGAEADPGLDLALVGVEDVAFAGPRGIAAPSMKWSMLRNMRAAVLMLSLKFAAPLDPHGGQAG